MARPVAINHRNLNERKRIVERRVSFAGVVDHFDRPVPDSRNRPAVTDRDEWRKPKLVAVVPTFGDDLGADSGGIAQRNRER